MSENMYRAKIDIVLFSKYPEIGKQFVESFLDTTKKFENIRLHYISLDHEEHIKSDKVVYIKTPLFGSTFLAPHLEKLLNEKTEFWGWANDDMWLSEGWLEDVFDKFDKGYKVVAPGVAETDDREHFLKCIEQTKNETGVSDHIYFALVFFNTRVFRTMGLLDDRFKGAADDMDVWWRILLNKIPACSSKKITVAHWVGTSTYRKVKAINKEDASQQRRRFLERVEQMKELFIKKHGYEAHHSMARHMKDTYKDYFAKFRYLKDE